MFRGFWHLGYPFLRGFEVLLAKDPLGFWASLLKQALVGYEVLLAPEDHLVEFVVFVDRYRYSNFLC